MEEEQMKEELKFPIDFDKCPACGSERRVAKLLTDQEKERDKIGKEAKAALWVVNSFVMDARIAPIMCPMITAAFDICYDCGTFYCFHAEVNLVQPQMQQKGKRPGQQPPQRPFGGGVPFSPS